MRNAHVREEEEEEEVPVDNAAGGGDGGIAVVPVGDIDAAVVVVEEGPAGSTMDDP